MKIPCNDCTSDEECRKAMEHGGNGNPCPAYIEAIEPYINQDYVKRKEILSKELSKEPMDV